LLAWFVGFTPGLTTSVWVGYDQPRSIGADAHILHLIGVPRELLQELSGAKIPDRGDALPGMRARKQRPISTERNSMYMIERPRLARLYNLEITPLARERIPDHDGRGIARSDPFPVFAGAK
jgi:membrane peptidoglycan carboxypeptidase